MSNAANISLRLEWTAEEIDRRLRTYGTATIHLGNVSLLMTHNLIMRLIHRGWDRDEFDWEWVTDDPHGYKRLVLVWLNYTPPSNKLDILIQKFRARRWKR